MTVKFNAVYSFLFQSFTALQNVYTNVLIYMIILYQGNENYAQPKKAESTFL